jgi:hypothetical protein
MSADVAELMILAEKERAIIHTDEAFALRQVIWKAMDAYWEYLNRNGLCWTDDCRPRATGLVAQYDIGMGGKYDVYLKDGPLHRLYGKGQDPWPMWDNDEEPLPPQSRTETARVPWRSQHE